MTKLTNFKNKFDAKSTKFAADAAEYAAAAKAKAAAKIFEDKPYSTEYAGIYNIARIIAIVANLVSLLTCLVALNYLLSKIIPAAPALGIAVVFTACLELLKNTLYRVNLKNYFRYYKYSAIAILMLFALSAASIASSVLGASLIPAEAAKLSAAEAAAAAPLQSAEAAIRAQITELDKQQGLLLSRDQESSTTKKLLKENAAAKAALLQQAEAAAAADAEAAAAAKADRAAAAAEAENEAGTVQLICIVLALLFELTYILATVYVYRYQFRIFVDTTDFGTQSHENSTASYDFRKSENAPENPQTRPENRPENVPKTRPRSAPAARKIGFYNSVLTNNPDQNAPAVPGVGTCPTCQKSFTKNHKKQVYCQDACRYSAHKAKLKD
jgi:hypothetical protein